MTIRLQSEISESTIAKLDRIQDYYGLSNRTAALNIAITNAYTKLFPDYVDTVKKRLEVTPEKAAAVVVAKEQAREQIKAQKEREEQIALAGKLDHSTIIEKDGKEYVQYPLYNMSSPKQVDATIDTIPLELLEEQHIVAQYHDILGNDGETAKKMVLKVLKEKE